MQLRIREGRTRKHVEALDLFNVCAEVTNIAQERLHEEGCLFGVGDPQDSAAVAGRGVIAALREPVADVKDL